MAKGISILFHPLFLVGMMLCVVYWLNPYAFPLQDPKALGLIFISVISLSIFFPILAIVLMKMLGMIESLEMKNDKERVGPLIASGIFYLWLYINIKDNSIIPPVFSYFVLGATIALFIGFFMNNFSKVSLHTIGVGGFLMGMILIRYKVGYDSFVLPIKAIGNYLINADLLIIVAVLIAGVVGTARLLLNAHRPDEVYGGYAIGAFSQLIAYLIFF